MCPCFTGYSDYGDYWRANYEADYLEEYKYSRDQLVEDVEKTFEQVEAGKTLTWAMGLCFVMGCSHFVKEDETCSKVADLGLHAVTDTGGHT